MYTTKDVANGTKVQVVKIEGTEHRFVAEYDNRATASEVVRILNLEYPTRKGA